MPDPKDFDSEDEFMAACVPEVEGEGKDNNQAVAQCMNMWKERGSKEGKSAEAEKEIRVLPIKEFRFEEEEGKPKFAGYAAVFNSWSEDLGGFREKIKKGAFKRALKNSDVRALYNHDQNYVLGRTTSNTLRLKEDGKGLYMENDPPNTSWAKDLQESVNRGDINQMSFGFTVADDSWKEDKNGYVERTINEIDRLFDVSIVAFPAYPDTQVALRNLEKAKAEKEKPSFEVVKEPEQKADDFEEKITSAVVKAVREVLSEKSKVQLEVNTEGEPSQANGETKEKEGGISEPSQGEEAREDRGNLFKKYDMEVFSK